MPTRSTRQRATGSSPGARTVLVSETSRHKTFLGGIIVRLASAFSTAFAIWTVAVADPALAVASKFWLDIPEQPLPTALQDLARQTGLQVAGLSEVLAVGSNVGPLKGQYSIEHAMDALLRPSGLTFSVVDGHTIAVLKAATTQAELTSAPEASAPMGPPVSAALTQSGEQPAAAPKSARPAQTGGTRAASGDTPQAEQPAVEEEIIVTGTHIPQTGMSTPTPVTAVSSDQLKEIKPGPVIEALNKLPQFLGNSTPGNGINFSTNSGQSFLNMRGLGVNRTLVLLDGRRVAPSSRLGATDISLFPQPLISRVEVVTGGASAAYGSDAVAGVANFILNTDFEGWEVNALTGVTDRGDNSTSGGSLTFGTGIGERVHVVASAEIYSADSVETLDDRNWYNSKGLVTNPQWLIDGTGPRLLRYSDVKSTRYTDGGLINAPGSGLDRLMFLPDGTVTPFIPGDPAAIGTGTFSQSGGSGYNLHTNYAGAGGLYPDFKRETAFGYIDFDVTDQLTAFVQVLYGHSMTNYVEGGGIQFAQWEGTIYQDNAYLPESVRQIMIDEEMESFGLSRFASKADIGNGRNQTSNNLVSATVGLKGKIGEWNVNAYYQDGSTESRSSLINYNRIDRLAIAQDAVIDPASGAVVCRSTLFNPGNGCIPINLLGAGNVSPEGLAYVQGTKVGYSEVKQRFAEVSANTKIFEGRSVGPTYIALGISTRDDSLEQHTDPADGTVSVPQNDPAQGIQGISPGHAGSPYVFEFSSFPTIAGSYKVHEAYAEALVPLFADDSRARQLNLSLGARYADYSGSGGVWAWKAGLDWNIVESFRLRGTISRDTRAANLAERFDSQGGGVIVSDPEFNFTNFELTQFSTGNPEVDPETADTLTFGAVFTPESVPGLQLSLDWFSIDTDGAIGQLGSQIIVDNCYAGDQMFCELITRDPVTNQLQFVRNEYLNISKAKVSGIDFEGAYVTDVKLFGGGPEQLSLRLIANYLDENSITNQGGTTNYAGQVDGGFAGFNLPQFQMIANLSYSNGPMRFVIAETFIAKNKFNVLYVEGVDVGENDVGSVAYTDFDISYTRAWDTTSELEIYGHITNAFDRAPPVVANYNDFDGATSYNQTVYDVLGRRYTLGMRVHF